MEYLEIQLICDESYRDIIIAELGVAGFESFWETEDGLNAYISKSEYDEELLKAVLTKYQSLTSISFEAQDLKEKNWNEEWEKNYDPIIVDDKIFVGASFHQATRHFSYQILINPRMSFGTGHHETTYLMLSYQLEIAQNQKKVLDLGCGTGILAIMAAKCGATKIVAVDNNDWAIENCKDNIVQNQASIELLHGTIEEVPAQKFDIVLANINRNVLLEESPKYLEYLADHGTLIMSGFYNHDIGEITKVIEPKGWKVESQKERNQWCALKFVKI